MEILFVDAGPRAESRSRKLAEKVLDHLQGNVTRLNLTKINLPVIDENAVNNRTLDKRNNCFEAPVYDWAKQFAKADCIVIAAPFWDMSFPAALKKYVEAITVSGITFRYSEEGIPVGLCAAKQLFYVTTAGGPVTDESFGYGYIRTLATQMYGIRECVCFKAENLDVIGNSVDAIMNQAADKIEEYFQNQ